MMQDTLVRVFVVALSLLSSLRDDSEVEEWGDITTMDMEKHEERPLRGGEQLDVGMAPVSVEKTVTDNGGPWGYIEIPEEENKSKTDQIPTLENMTVTKSTLEEDDADQKFAEGEHLNAIVDPSEPRNTENDPVTLLKTSQTGHEPKKEDDQKDDPDTPRGKPEEMEAFSSKESPVSHFHTQIPEKETSEKTLTDWEKDYLVYLWNTLSIISMIRLFWKYLGRNSQMKEEETRTLFKETCAAADVQLPDGDTLQRFHSKCTQVANNKRWGEFLDGFADDLLAAMKTVCDGDGSMVIKDFEMVDVCNIIVPLTPPDPYSFQSRLWNNHKSDLLPDMQVCGQIKLAENKTIPAGCHCQSPGGEDMVCLLHCETGKAKVQITDVYDGPLCMKNSPFLSQSQVTRWFQSTIKQAWATISHKYEFELNVRYFGAPGDLTIRFRSGKKISLTLNPVVKFTTGAHFLITPCSPTNLDTFWALSLTQYEDSFLQQISKRLPADSCHYQTLEIACFLHKRQTALSGSSALKDFHFKIALMHLLLTKDPSQWKPSNATYRLHDLLAFIEESLKKKLLRHVLIGNPQARMIIELPAAFAHVKAVNLFHPLVAHNCIYTGAVKHFQEMLRNANMLICDYVN